MDSMSLSTSVYTHINNTIKIFEIKILKLYRRYIQFEKKIGIEVKTVFKKNIYKYMK